MRASCQRDSLLKYTLWHVFNFFPFATHCHIRDLPPQYTKTPITPHSSLKIALISIVHPSEIRVSSHRAFKLPACLHDVDFTQTNVRCEKAIWNNFITLNNQSSSPCSVLLILLIPGASASFCWVILFDFYFILTLKHRLGSVAGMRNRSWCEETVVKFDSTLRAQNVTR